MAQYLALITVLMGPHQPPVDPGYSPPWARPQPPRPDNTLPQPPLGTWGGVAPPHMDNTLPQPPLGTWGGVAPPYPSHPIAPGGQPPLGIWGGGNVPMPTPPIYIPPAGGQPPLGIWGPTDPRPGHGLPGPQPKPEHPIVLPPDLPPTTPEGGAIDWKCGWTPTTGWVIVGVPAEDTPVPTPSK